MDSRHQDLVKHREIRFCGLHPDQDQVQSAMFLLSDVDGIERLHPLGPLCLSISYDIRTITLQIIETALAEVGFHLDNSLLCKLRRALYYYAEETQRANLGFGTENPTRDVFINRYQRLRHGCRDDRPRHWRRYL